MCIFFRTDKTIEKWEGVRAHLLTYLNSVNIGQTPETTGQI